MLGALGWLMKHGGWPRAPALVGFVLSSPMEQYFWLTNQIHGWSWVTRPGVLIIASIIVIPLLISGVRRLRQWQSGEAVASEAEGVPAEQCNHSLALVLAALASALFLYALWETFTFNPASRLMPLLAIAPGVPLTLWLVLRGVREYRSDLGRDAGELRILAVLLAYAVALWAIGLTIPTLVLLGWMLLAKAQMRIWTATLYGAVVFGLIWFLFDVLRGDPPVGALIPFN